MSDSIEINWTAVRAYLRASRAMREAHGTGRCYDMHIYNRSRGRMSMAASMRIEEQWLAGRIGIRFRMNASALLDMVWTSASIGDARAMAAAYAAEEEARGSGPDRYPALERDARGRIVDVG